MPEFLWNFMADDLIYGELTDCCWSDVGGAPLPDEQDLSLPEPRVLSNQKAKRRERTKLNRNQKRSRMQEELGTGLKISTLKKFPAHSSRVALQTGFDTMDSQVTVPGWVGQSLRSLPSLVYTLEQLTQSFNLQLIPWKGRQVREVLLLLPLSYLLSRTTHLLMDREKRVIGLLAGQPKSGDWATVCNKTFVALDRLAERVAPSEKDIQSRRGIFPTIAYGISLGNGQKVSIYHLCSICSITSPSKLILYLEATFLKPRIKTKG